VLLLHELGGSNEREAIPSLATNRQVIAGGLSRAIYLGNDSVAWPSCRWRWRGWR
jgi:hypothetical protein